MRLVKQTTEFPVINFDEVTGSGMKRQLRKHGPLFPDSVRNITCGPSNSGKTNILLNLICDPQGLEYEHIYVFSKSLAQDKYKTLAELMKGQKVGYHTYSDNAEVPHPNDIHRNSLMIFDDVSCEKQGHMRNYFAMGRHNCVDTLYLCQTYSTVPKQLVRDNANFIILFKQDEMNMRHVFTDHVTPDMTFEKFKELCGKAWSASDHGFLVICKDFGLDKGRYRVGFDTFVQLS